MKNASWASPYAFYAAKHQQLAAFLHSPLSSANAVLVRYVVTTTTQLVGYDESVPYLPIFSKSVTPVLMDTHFNSEYPSVEHLRAKAKSRMPGFAYDYLSAGCFTEVNLARNSSDIRRVQLKPWYLRDFSGANQTTELFGEEYDSPFGIAPVGLQGLMWPRACEYLAKSAVDHNVPFVLSTVSTASIEEIGEITVGEAASGAR